jgi:hypothetical protein
MSLRVGASRRYRRGSVWASTSVPWPLALFAAMMMLLYLVIRLEIWLIVWAVQQAVAELQRLAAWIERRRRERD